MKKIIFSVLFLFVHTFCHAQLVNGGVVSGVISAAGEEDHYEFTANSGESVILSAVETGVLGSFKPRVELYSLPSLTEVGKVENPLVALKEFTLLETGSYRVVVRDGSGQGAGGR